MVASFVNMDPAVTHELYIGSFENMDPAITLELSIGSFENMDPVITHELYIQQIWPTVIFYNRRTILNHTGKYTYIERY